MGEPLPEPGHGAFGQRVAGIWFSRSKESASYLHLTPRRDTAKLDMLLVLVGKIDELADRFMAAAESFQLDNKVYLKIQQILLIGGNYAAMYQGLKDSDAEKFALGPSVLEIPGYMVLQVELPREDTLHLRFMNPDVLEELAEKEQIKPLLNEGDSFGLLQLSQEELVDLIRQVSPEKLFVDGQAETFFNHFTRISAEPVDTGHSHLGIYRVIALTDVAEVQVRSGDLDGATKTADLAVKAAAYLSGTEFPFCRVAEIQAKVGDLKGALQKASRVPLGTWERDRAFGEIAVAQAEKGDAARVVTTLKQITAGWSRMRALMEITAIRARRGDNAGAEKTLNLAVSEAKAMESHWDSMRAMRFIAEQQAKMGNNAGAKRTAALAAQYVLGEAEGCPRGLVGIAKTQVELGDTAAALGTLEHVLSCVDSVENPHSRVITLARSAPVLAKAGERAEGIAAAKKAIDLAFSTDTLLPNLREEDINRMLAELADITPEQGDFTLPQEVATLALDYAKRLNSKSARGPVRTIAAVAQARGGDITGALEALKGTEWDYRAEAFGKIAAMQFKAGDKTGAETTVRLAVQAAKSLYFITRGLRRLGEAMAEEGYSQGAKEVFALAVESVSGSPYLCALELSEIAEAQLKAGDESGARKTATLAYETAKEISLLH